MLSQSIWWGSIILEVLVLLRGSQQRLVSKYPVFYSYIFFVLAQDVVLIWLSRNKAYPTFYWIAEFLSVLFGCLVVFEIFRVALAAFPGVARMSRYALAFVFLVALAKALLSAANDSSSLMGIHGLDVERVLRTIQAIALVALVALFVLYSIPFGRNLRGILIGYGLFVGTRLISLTFVPPSGHNFWFYLYSASFFAALGIWLAHVWSYHANPIFECSLGPLEHDYQRAAAGTRSRLQAARGQLAKAVRS
jgi:hypothetical protein